MAARKRAAKKATPKKQSNSNIAAAQQETTARRKYRAEALQAKREQGKSAPADKPATDPKLKAAQDAIDPHRPRQPVLEQNARPGEAKSADDATPAFKAATEAANKIAGLGSGIMDRRQAEQKARSSTPNPLADASKYGSTNNAARAQRVTDLMNAKNAATNKKLTTAGKAVWMGYQRNRAKIRNQGPERMDPEGLPGKDYTLQAVGDDIRSADELMSWLADEKTFNQIRDAATKAGIAVKSYDDVAKIWQQVVQQAASTYSTTGKKVTPWSLLQLRGKTMVNGKPASKTTTSTSIDEVDPAEAKVMIKNSLQQMLGRDPRQDEIEDFISKAQTIAKANPSVTTTTTQYGFDGVATDQSSVSKGGGSLSESGGGVVGAKAKLAAEELAKDAPDYKDYQAAGVMMPWLNEALAAPF